MKKVISLFVSMLLVFSFVCSAVAADTKIQIVQDETVLIDTSTAQTIATVSDTGKIKLDGVTNKYVYHNGAFSGSRLSVVEYDGYKNVMESGDVSTTTANVRQFNFVPPETMTEGSMEISMKLSYESDRDAITRLGPWANYNATAGAAYDTNAVENVWYDFKYVVNVDKKTWNLTMTPEKYVGSDAVPTAEVAPVITKSGTLLGSLKDVRMWVMDYGNDSNTWDIYYRDVKAVIKPNPTANVLEDTTGAATLKTLYGDDGISVDGTKSKNIVSPGNYTGSTYGGEASYGGYTGVAYIGSTSAKNKVLRFFPDDAVYGGLFRVSAKFSIDKDMSTQGLRASANYGYDADGNGSTEKDALSIKVIPKKDIWYDVVIEADITNNKFSMTATPERYVASDAGEKFTGSDAEALRSEVKKYPWGVLGDIYLYIYADETGFKSYWTDMKVEYIPDITKAEISAIGGADSGFELLPGGNEIEVTLSEAIPGLSADYIELTGDSAALSSAEISADGKTITIVNQNALPAEGNYTLTIDALAYGITAKETTDGGTTKTAVTDITKTFKTSKAIASDASEVEPEIIVESGDVKGTIKLYNNTSEKISYDAYLAVYDNAGELVGIKLAKIEAEAGEIATISLEGLDEDTSVKLLVWNGLAPVKMETR